MGFIKTMSTEMSSDMYLSDVISYAHAAMADNFDEQTAMIARNNPDRLHHVYEPSHTGERDFQLWEHRLYGRGKSRQASFEWKESVLPIEKPRERHNDPNDPMSKVPMDVIDKLSDQDYIFFMRAPIMEYRMRVNITPKNAKYLFIPTFQGQARRGNANDTWQKQVNYRFDKQNLPDWDYRNPQEPSGGDGTVGQFTAQWVGFWAGGGADATWNDNVKRVIEKDTALADAEISKAARTRTRKRRGTAALSVFADNDAAFEAGANLARAFVHGKAKSYTQAAKYIRKRGLFGRDNIEY